MAGCDKLILLNSTVRPKYFELAKEGGARKGGYAWVLDLRKLEKPVPAMLFVGGIHNGINKLQFFDVSQLGLSEVRRIASEIFGSLLHVRIYRIDWYVDLWDVPVLSIGPYCFLSNVQNCAMERSRYGITFYLRRSKQNVLLIYDRLGKLRRDRSPLTDYFEQITRVEVQLKGSGVPFRKFSDIALYANTDLLRRLSVWQFTTAGLNTTSALAAETLFRKIKKYGVQLTSKMYSAQEWPYLRKRFLTPDSDSRLPDLKNLLRKGICDWLEDRIRFPRLRERAKS